MEAPSYLVLLVLVIGASVSWAAVIQRVNARQIGTGIDSGNLFPIKMIRQELSTANNGDTKQYTAERIQNSVHSMDTEGPEISDPDSQNFNDSTNSRVAAESGQMDDLDPRKMDDDARDRRIKQLVADFKLLQPKEITDNRITKFIFSDESELATSQTVQTHNKEIAVAFADFRRKLKETLNPGVKPLKNYRKMGLTDSTDNCVHRVVSFLDRTINKLEGRPNRQELKPHDSGDDDGANVPTLMHKQLRYPPLVETRDDLENILIGVDRPRSQKVQRRLVNDN